MRSSHLSAALLGALLISACGVGGAPSARNPTSRQALTQSPETLELEPATARQELFRDVARISQLEAGRAAHQPVLFPVLRDGELVAAPGFDIKMDLLQAPDAGLPLELSFSDRAERWPDDRREGLQGLSEREAAELVARTLLAHWNIHPAGAVKVDRASGVPYAAAYVDGVLRVNPSFLYMVAASPSSSAAANQ